MSKDPVTAITVTDTGRHTCYVDVAVLPWHLQCGDFIERIGELDQPQAVELAVKEAQAEPTDCDPAGSYSDG